MAVIQTLIDLQEVDGRIRELELELKDLPRRKALETARLSGVSADLEAAKAGQEYASQRVKNYEADAQALKDKIQQLKSTQATLKSNKGHRSVGGFRASCYNAQTIEGVNALVACMKEFESKN